MVLHTVLPYNRNFRIWKHSPYIETNPGHSEGFLFMLLWTTPHWDHSGYGFSQWEKALHSNASSHWLSPYQNDPSVGGTSICLLWTIQNPAFCWYQLFLCSWINELYSSVQNQHSKSQNPLKYLFYKIISLFVIQYWNSINNLAAIQIIWQCIFSSMKSTQTRGWFQHKHAIIPA